ncbi:MAG: carbohydrate binding domain-containing protein [Kiritimatiellia bacterium]|nr:carbohydrate binding domain-containing protein [Kiritimatiellia bacterium]
MPIKKDNLTLMGNRGNTHYLMPLLVLLAGAIIAGIFYYAYSPHKQRAKTTTVSGKVVKRALGALKAMIAGKDVAAALKKNTGEWQSPTNGASSDFTAAPADELANGSFENDLAGWVFQAFEKAEGRGEIDKDFAREGGKSIYLQKQNAEGMLSLRTSAPLTVEPNKDYTFRAYYKADNVYYGSSLLLMRIEQMPGDLNYDSGIDGGFGLTTQCYPINSGKGRWQKKLYNLRMRGNTTKVYLHFLLIGNPGAVWIDHVTMEPKAAAEKNWANSNPPYGARSEPAARLSKDELSEKLEQSENCYAKLEIKDGITALMVNGRPVCPVFLKPESYYPERTCNKTFYENGIKIHLLSQKFGMDAPADSPETFNYFKSMWTGHQTYNFQNGLMAIEEALRKAPDAYLILELSLNPYKGWADRYPEECWQNKQGQRAYTTGGHVFDYVDQLPPVPKGAYLNYDWMYSYHSEVWRKEAGEALINYLEYLKKTPYYKRVIGFMVDGGHDGQFANTSKQDFSRPAREGYRRWLRNKYQTDANLAKAWNKPGMTFDQVESGDFASDGGRFVYDPSKEMEKIDGRMFNYATMWGIVEYYAKILKENAGKPIIISQYFWDQMRTGPTSSKGAPQYFFKSKYLDGVGPQPRYPFRNNGIPFAMSQPMESYLINNKLNIMEFDQRTWRRSSQNKELDQIEHTVAQNPEEFADIHRKMLGEMLARGSGFWYYDMVSGWFDDPAIYREIGDCAADAEHISQGKKKFKADVAVVIYEETDYRCSYNPDAGVFKALDDAQLHQLPALYMSGVPYDFYYMEDIVNRPELQNYTVYVFLSAWYLTGRDREVIEKLKSNGRTLVWVYIPGYISDNGLNVNNIEKVTGIKVAGADAFTPPEPVYVSNPKHELAKGLPPLQGCAYLGRMSWQMQKSPISYLDYPRFYAEDSAVEVLAKFPSDAAAAIVVRKFPNWRSIYVAQPGGLSAELLNNIARTAGAYVLTAPGPGTEMNDNFICVHGIRAGEYTFQLRKPKTVKDLRNKKTIATNATEFKFWIEGGKSYWFGLY